MMALGQITFTQSPEIFEHITAIKAIIADLGMPVAKQRQQIVTINVSGTASPRVIQSSIWWFSSLDKTRAFAVAQNSLVLYDTNYKNFDQFKETLKTVVNEIVKIGGKGCFLTTVALRYLSGFAADGWPSPYLVSGLYGLPTEQLSTSHFHHQYSFWCTTENDGKLVLSVKTMHGNQLVPTDLQTVGVVFGSKFSLPKDSDAVQLDIHETLQRKELKNLDPLEIERLLTSMRINIKRAFLSATTPEAYTKWKMRSG